MKTINYSSLFLLLMVVTSCNDQGNQPDIKEPKDTVTYKCPSCPNGVPFDSVEECPLPYNLNNYQWRNLREFNQFAVATSFKGDYIIIDSTRVMNLFSKQIYSLLPSEVIPLEFGASNVDASLIAFSPLENTKVLMTTETNLPDESGIIVKGRGIFIIDFIDKSVEKISPSLFGKAGNLGWEKGSIVSWIGHSGNATSLEFSDDWGSYYIKADRFIIPSGYPGKIISKSPNANFTVEIRYQFPDLNTQHLYINTQQIAIDSTIEKITGVSWSNDSKYMAITGSIYSKTFGSNYELEEFSGIWVYKLLDENKPPLSGPVNYSLVNKIIPRKQFCKYIWDDIYRNITFLPSNNLAIAMQDHNSNYAYIHEITLDGKYVKQLTFVK
ncbi:MAG: hypothetical protein JNL36_09645 [Candidatus Kapabacteria bacterium]|nr:hypothetical protein [Candidatus Kapabacteria bacterium]